MLFVNFKTYPQATGSNAARLVKILEEAAREAEIKIIPVVDVPDLGQIKSSKLEIWVQKIDEEALPEKVLEEGASGTFLNHSQYPIDNSTIARLVTECSKLNLKIMIFAKDLSQLREVIKTRPTYVAYEPPELIASSDTSVAKARPEIIEEAAKLSKSAGIPLVVGAGIKDREDVRKSLQFGAVGVAVSSAIVLAKDQKKAVLELLGGFE